MENVHKNRTSIEVYYTKLTTPIHEDVSPHQTSFSYIYAILFLIVVIIVVGVFIFWWVPLKFLHKKHQLNDLIHSWILQKKFVFEITRISISKKWEWKICRKSYIFHCNLKHSLLILNAYMISIFLFAWKAMNDFIPNYLIHFCHIMLKYLYVKPQIFTHFNFFQYKRLLCSVEIFFIIFGSQKISTIDKIS